jgi:hypothetical protein
MAACEKCGTDLWGASVEVIAGVPAQPGHIHNNERCLTLQLAKMKQENIELKNEMYRAGWYHCHGCDRPVLENARCPRCGT